MIEFLAGVLVILVISALAVGCWVALWRFWRWVWGEPLDDFLITLSTCTSICLLVAGIVCLPDILHGVGDIVRAISEIGRSVLTIFGLAG